VNRQGPDAPLDGPPPHGIGRNTVSYLAAGQRHGAAKAIGQHVFSSLGRRESDDRLGEFSPLPPEAHAA
jgi:hypothetical protein